MRPHIVSLVGARPQFVKIAPLARTLSLGKFKSRLRHTLVHSGQHYHPGLSDVFFKQLKIPTPRVNLGVGSSSHGKMTAEILWRFENELLRLKPDVVFVYGDTNTTLAGALAAAKLGIPIAHVEAGLRSFDRDMPEEINRVCADHLSDLLLCPTRESIANLKKESVPGKIIRSGDLMYELLEDLKPGLKRNKSVLSGFDLRPGEFALVTAHRAENVDTKKSLSETIAMISALRMPAIFALHPRTKASLARHGLSRDVKAIGDVILCEPLSYIDTLTLAQNAALVLTDSGGLQKESTFLGTKTLTMRKITEWPETLKLGNHQVGRSPAKLLRAIKAKHTKRKMKWKPRGEKPSRLIAKAILERYG